MNKPGDGSCLCVGKPVGVIVGVFEGFMDGCFVGLPVGAAEGFMVGCCEGNLDDFRVAFCVGAAVGFKVGVFEGFVDGVFVGSKVEAAVVKRVASYKNIWFVVDL